MPEAPLFVCPAPAGYTAAVKSSKGGRRLISKSRYTKGLQCAKLLWYDANAREQMPPFDAETQAKFDQGHEVGRLAQQLFPGGIAVEDGLAFGQVIARSRRLLRERRSLFEPGFQHRRVIARADVLEPAAGGVWNLVEVKSTTEVKDYHLDDLAIQRWCYEGAGLPIGTCSLVHVDRTYVRQGSVEPARLLARVDVTDEVRARSEGIEARVGEMLKTVDAGAAPEVEIGPQCGTPYPCPLIPMCWKKVHETKNSVHSLTRIGAKVWSLFRQGVETTDRIPADFRLSPAQKIQITAEKTGTPHVDAEAVRAFLSTLLYPLHYLDFETFQSAVPLVDGTRPYQQIPFEFSLHVAASEDSPLEHCSWLWDGRGDPARLLLEELRTRVGPRGSVVAYNAAFETTRLGECSAAHPEHAPWVEQIVARTVDLFAPFKSFDVYFPSQAGSASMKEVLPALTGREYRDLAIRDGAQASLEFRRVTFAEAPEEERPRVRRQLEEYCGLDTEGMADIVKSLRRLAG
jgi:hypothetical protein